MDHKHSTACSLKMIAFEPLRDTIWAKKKLLN